MVTKTEYHKAQAADDVDKMKKGGRWAKGIRSAFCPTAESVNQTTSNKVLWGLFNITSAIG